MGQIKVYGLKENINKNRLGISNAIHSSIVKALTFPEEKRFQRFIKLDDEDFIFPDSRSSNYLIIEIIMFEGRTKKVKADLINLIFINLKKEVGIDSNDVEITIIEESSENWGIRGQVGSDLKLNYKINI